MKRKILLFVLGFIGLNVQISTAQTTIIEETFDDNAMGWSENSRIAAGECIIMEGKFMFDSKESYFLDSHDNFYPHLLISEGEMPIDPLKGFELSFDICFKHVGPLYKGNILISNGLNYTSGVLLDYDDDYNYIAIAVNEDRCFIFSVQQGKIVRFKEAAVKMMGKDNKNISANIKIIYGDFKLKVFVDDIEMTEIRKINIESPLIALFTTSKRKVDFDNVIIKQ